MQETTQNPYLIPGAIIIAGALIAGVVFYKDQGSASPNIPGTTAELSIPGITENDHIIGNPNADIVIVEYSDLECPYCKAFHNTMKVIMDEFGKNGQVAWVYRNFPIENLHPNAPKIAEAAECVAEEKGNDAYWKFLDVLFREAPVNLETGTNKTIEMDQLPAYAAEVGVNATTFATCLESGRHKAKIDRQIGEAMTAGESIPGGIGTPFNILLVKDRAPIPVVGAQPLPAVRQIIETVLADLKQEGTQTAPTVQ